MRIYSLASHCRRPLRLVRVACLLALGAAGPDPTHAAHDASVDLMVVNHSRQAITQLYASDSGSDQWGDDHLADAALAAGKSIHIRLPRPPDCRIDLQAIYADESSEETYGLDACATRLVSFDGTGAASPTSLFSRAHQITLTNRTGRPIQQVYISPSEADQWGDDRLGQGSISVGDSRPIGFRGPCTSDLRVVFDNGAAEERRSLDLCAMPALIIEPGWTTADRPPVPAAAQAPAEGKVTVDIVNRSGRMVRQLFLFPEGGTAPGPNVLGGSALGAGTRITVNMQRGAGCLYAAHVVPGGGVPDWDMTGIDLCRASVVDLPPA